MWINPAKGFLRKVNSFARFSIVTSSFSDSSLSWLSQSLKKVVKEELDVDLVPVAQEEIYLYLG